MILCIVLSFVDCGVPETWKSQIASNKKTYGLFVWLVAGADLFGEKSSFGWLLVASLFRDKNTAGWWQAVELVEVGC
jgi:hypothetical protein